MSDRLKLVEGMLDEQRDRDDEIRRQEYEPLIGIALRAQAERMPVDSEWREIALEWAQVTTGAVSRRGWSLRRGGEA